MADGFVFVDDYHFWWPVDVRYPGTDGTITRSFRVKFRLIDEDALFARSDLADDATVLDAIAADRARLREIVLDWEGVTLESGAAMPFTLDNLDRLLQLRPVRLGIGEAYLDAQGLGGERGNG